MRCASGPAVKTPAHARLGYDAEVAAAAAAHAAGAGKGQLGGAWIACGLDGTTQLAVD